jgi:ribonuclease BN (tRNA processing enzyme)
MGVGSAFSYLYDNTAALVEFDGNNLLIDCGQTITKSLKKNNVDVAKIQNMAITHIHADHVGGIEEIAFRTKYITKKKIRLFVPKILQALLWENSLKGGLRYTPEGQMSFEDYFDMGNVPTVETNNQTGRPDIPFVHNWFKIGDTSFKFIKVNHVHGKRCYGIWCPGKFLYTGDTKFDPETIDIYGRDVKRIFHDCGFVTGIPHASIYELCTLPDNIKKKIVLMHYSDDAYRFEMMAAENGMQFAKPGEPIII